MTRSATAVSAARDAGPRHSSPRSEQLGITALVMAAAFVPLLRIGGLVLLADPALPLPPDPFGVGWTALLQTAGMIGAFGAGLAALLTGRGRWWGLAAMLLAVLGDYLLQVVLVESFPPMGKG
jgi:hypothetical protein